MDSVIELKKAIAYNKASSGRLLQKFSKNGNLLREAEQFNSGHWVVFVFKGVDISGEYTPEEFKKIKKYF